MDGVGVGGVTYRNVDSRTNLSSQPLLLLESKEEIGAKAVNDGDIDEDVVEGQRNQGIGIPGPGTIGVVGPIRRASITTGIHSSSTREEEEDAEDAERRDHFDIHDIDSDALSRLIEMDLDSKL